MAITLLENINKNTGDWLALRKRTIGSSEIAGVCGLNPYRSPLKIWMEKTGKIEPEDDNDFMFLGREYEPTIAKMFRRKHEELPSDPVHANCLFGHDSEHWATCTPDYFLYLNDKRRILECKSSTIRALKSWDGESVPEDKRVQVIWQLGICGDELGYLAALIGGFEYREAEVEFYAPLFGQLMEVGKNFMEFVGQDIPPTAGPNDKALIQALYSEQQDKTIELPLEAEGLIVQWEELQEIKKAKNEDMKYVTEKLDGIQNNLRLMLGDASNGTLGSWSVRIKKSFRKGYSVADSTTERFTIKNLAENE